MTLSSYEGTVLIKIYFLQEQQLWLNMAQSIPLYLENLGLQTFLRITIKLFFLDEPFALTRKLERTFSPQSKIFCAIPYFPQEEGEKILTAIVVELTNGNNTQIWQLQEDIILAVRCAEKYAPPVQQIKLQDYAQLLGDLHLHPQQKVWKTANLQALSHETLPAEPTTTRSCTAEITTSEVTRKLYIYSQASAWLGRSEKAQIQPAAWLLPATRQQRISAYHAQLTYHGNFWAIRDYSSYNQTWKNGKLLSPEKPVILHDGDQINLAQVLRLRVRVWEEPSQQTLPYCFIENPSQTWQQALIHPNWGTSSAVMLSSLETPEVAYLLLAKSLVVGSHPEAQLYFPDQQLAIWGKLTFQKEYYWEEAGQTTLLQPGQSFAFQQGKIKFQLAGQLS